MPIVLNGSGTVTGISVGGLPDGIVDAGTLASNSVETSKINAKAATGPKLGNGAILQILQAEKTDTASTTSNTFTAISGLSQEITRSSTSNGVLITFTVYICTASATVAAFNIMRDSTAIAQSGGSATYKGTTQDYIPTNSLSRHTVEYYDATPGSANPITYSIHWSDCAGEIAYLGSYHTNSEHTSPSYLILKEVAA